MPNLFPKGKERRTISINAKYMIIFKNSRDNTQLVNLAKQMFPGRVRYMQEAFRDATSVPHGYLFVNLKQSTPEHLRLPSNIIRDSGTYQYAYIPKIEIETRRSHIHRPCCFGRTTTLRYFPQKYCLQNNFQHTHVTLKTARL